MRGIGNDIIDLRSVNSSRTQSPKFYSKILSPAEQQLYHQQFAHLPLHYFVWLLWSVKESAYKCLQRHQPDLVFTPVKVEVTQLVPPAHSCHKFAEQVVSVGFNQDDCFKSIVQYKDRYVYARSIIYGDEVINTVAVFDDNFANVNWGLKRIVPADPAGQSLAVREFLIQHLAKLFPEKEIHINKADAGYPFVTVDSAMIDLPVSLSHHDRFVGYSLLV